jgi:hypothetical protein
MVISSLSSVSVQRDAMSSSLNDGTSRNTQSGSRRAIDRGTARIAGRMNSRTIWAERRGSAISRHLCGKRKYPAAGSCVEFENVPILNDVRALYHQTVVLVRPPEETCVPKMLREVTVHMRGRILHRGTAAK